MNLPKVTVLIVDDHQIFRQGLRDSMSLDEDIEVVGEASDGETALLLAHQLAPRCVADRRQPPRYQRLATSATYPKGKCPACRLVVLTAYDDEEQLYHAVRSGAHAYFSKDVSPARIVQAVRQVSQGQYVVGDKVLSQDEIAPWLLRTSERFVITSGDEWQEAFVPLSPREMEIIRHITRGMSNKMFAHTLGISHQTVKNHMTLILRQQMWKIERRPPSTLFSMVGSGCKIPKPPPIRHR